jgi:hypothetical protein
VPMRRMVNLNVVVFVSMVDEGPGPVGGADLEEEGEKGEKSEGGMVKACRGGKKVMVEWR